MRALPCSQANIVAAINGVTSLLLSLRGLNFSPSPLIETFGMTSEGFGEMFESDFADNH